MFLVFQVSAPQFSRTITLENQSHRAQATLGGCIDPDAMPDGQCPGANDVKVDSTPVCITSLDVWQAQDPNMAHDTGADDGLGDGGWTATTGTDVAGLSGESNLVLDDSLILLVAGVAPEDGDPVTFDFRSQVPMLRACS
jgi:hypothetical protein